MYKNILEHFIYLEEYLNFGHRKNKMGIHVNFWEYKIYSKTGTKKKKDQKLESFSENIFKTSAKNRIINNFLKKQLKILFIFLILIWKRALNLLQFKAICLPVYPKIVFLVSFTSVQYIISNTPGGPGGTHCVHFEVETHTYRARAIVLL